MADSKALVAAWFEAWNTGNVSLLDNVFDKNVVDNSAGQIPGLPKGIEGMRQSIQMYRAGFPDAHMRVDDTLVDGDKIVVRWTATGTNTGPMMGMPPTGKKVSVIGMGISRVAGGKIVESWGAFDQLGMLQQLGIVPVMGG